MVKLIISLAVAAPLLLGWSWGNFAPKAETCSFMAKPREFNSEPYYTGPLIDAHIHMPVSSGIVSMVGKRAGFNDMPAFGGSLTTGHLNCLFKSEGITKVFGFFLATKWSSGFEVATVKKMAKSYPGLIAPFWMPAPISFFQVSPGEVRKILDKNKGLFKGIGELKSFGDLGDIDNPGFLEMYKIADDYNLIVMLHPYGNHKQAVEKILKDYPKVKFLMHGGEKEIEEWITGIMKNYGNVYYSLDGDIAMLYGWGNPKYQFTISSGKQEVLAHLRENFNSILEEKTSFWKPKIEAYPDRFMWGTDRWYSWHWDQELGGLLEEYGRSFIGQLAPSVREKFAYKNAENLIAGAGK